MTSNSYEAERLIKEIMLGKSTKGLREQLVETKAIE